MKVTLFTHGCETPVALAAKMCYSGKPVDGIIDRYTSQDNGEFIEHIVEIGHESPLEHVSFTFLIEGISRACLAQLTRHRMASYSVRSQRYVEEATPTYVIPPNIQSDPQMKEIYEKAMRSIWGTYGALANELEDDYIHNGMDAKSAKKKAIEDARYVLPNACDTQLMMTINARSLLNFFKLRCCNRAQWEIRALANEMLKQVKGVCPNIFKNAGAPCVSQGKCDQGSMGCGRKVI